MSVPSSQPEVDGAALHAIIERFRAHHALRLARTGARLIDRHRRVLEVLPMLYHRNHPALPGYVGADVPHGIANYRPADSHLQALRRVARSYVEPRLPPPRTDLQAMFLMGSGGTVGQGRDSDIDLWVCCDTLLHPALWPKVRMIDRWAAELGLELHTFLVDPDVLRTRRRLPGSRIPMLVLDEFYRSGALMAGRYPMWWLVAEDDPQRYAARAERLIQQRFVPAHLVVDFGPAAPVPADELADAALTELERSLTTPHKSLLKLKLMQAYALAPELGPVSSTYRARIHAGERDPLRMDSYLLLYEHVERFLLASGRERELPFARSLLIGKTAASLPTLPDDPRGSGEAAALLKRFLDWGIDAARVGRFRDLDGWSMAERLAEHERILRALEDGIELVQSLAERAMDRADERHPLPDADRAGTRRAPAEQEVRLHWLNESRLRRVRGAVRRMRSGDAGRIAMLHPALVSRRRALTLRLERDRAGWLVTESGAPLRRFARLVAAVVWCRLNGVSLAPARPGGSVAELLAQVHQGLAQQAEVHAFVNVESDQRALPRAAERHPAAAARPPAMLTLRGDRGDFSGFHQLRLESLDLVSRDRHGHWHLRSALDEAALIQQLGQLFGRAPDPVCWQVPGGRERFLLARRLEQLHRLAWRVLQTAGAMFVFPFGAAMVSLHRPSADALDIRRHASVDELHRHARHSGCTTLGVDPVSQRLKTFP